MTTPENYWSLIWRQFKKNKIALCALIFLGLFFLIGLYAPLFASSKPLLVYWDHHFYFPLLRYLFYPGFYTKPLDLFFNLLMFTFPIALGALLLFRKRGTKVILLSGVTLHCALFGWFLAGAVKNPTNDLAIQTSRKEASESLVHYHEDPLLSPLAMHTNWEFELRYQSDYAKLNQLLDYKHLKAQNERLITARLLYEEKTGREMPTLWYVRQRNESSKEAELLKTLQETETQFHKAREQLGHYTEAYRPYSHAFIMAKYALEHSQNETEKKKAEEKFAEVVKQAATHRLALANARHVLLVYQKAQGELAYLTEKKVWLEKENQKLKVLIPPLVRSFHWEEDAGGAQEANRFVPWWELTRVNRKDLMASLLFGIRISMVVGILAVVLALLIGIPLGMIAGYFAGKTDLLICRILEMWEAMPTFFMLLLVVAITESKSLFLVIAVLGMFGWTGFSRFMRSEVLKQRKLPYVDACHSLGFTHGRIMFSHILPNAIPPILTLLPFAMMAAITSEAGLSFLGLGEEGSTSWGVLMDEGRSAFPAESYLLWPPAILLTILLICIAIVGDAFRDAIDPKMRQ